MCSSADKLDAHGLWAPVAAIQHLHASLDTTRHTLQSAAVQQLLHPTSAVERRHFDVIVHEVFLDDALLGIGHHFGAPTVGLSPIGAYKLTADLVAGTPAPIAYTPHIWLPLTDRMSFAQRLWNTAVTLAEHAFVHLIYQPAHQALFEQFFPCRFAPSTTLCPTLARLQANVSLVLLNTHFSLGYPRAYQPGMIEVGGLHLSSRLQTLPPRIARFLDGADKGGAVLFSMGSVLRGSAMPVALVSEIRRAFKALGRSRRRLRVLWKWEDEMEPADDAESDSNDDATIMRVGWLPQEAVLAHRNVRVFITHGGQLSCIEAVRHAVPLIGVPIYGDQMHNVERAVAGGYGMRLDYANVTATSLRWALKEMLDSGGEAWRRRAAEVSARFNDRPEGTAMDRAVWWIEYVARHRGAAHLRSGAAALYWWSAHGLDVAAVLGAGAIAGGWLVWRMVVMVVSGVRCWRRKVKTE